MAFSLTLPDSAQINCVISSSCRSLRALPFSSPGFQIIEFLLL